MYPKTMKSPTYSRLRSDKHPKDGLVYRLVRGILNITKMFFPKGRFDSAVRLILFGSNLGFVKWLQLRAPGIKRRAFPPAAGQRSDCAIPNIFLVTAMTLTYSAIARTGPDLPLASPTIASDLIAASSSTLPVSPPYSQQSGIQHLILDAGPLLSLTPLRHLASSFHTTPLVIAELKDPKAREHWERLSLSVGNVKVEMPNAEVMAKGEQKNLTMNSAND